MEDYEAKVNCHIFLDANSYEQLLVAICKWWTENLEETKIIETITFTPDNNGITAEVFWCYLREEQKKAIDDIVATPQPLSVNGKNISGN